MYFLDRSTNQQQTGNNKIIMENGDNNSYSQSNDLDTTESFDNSYHEGSELRVHTNNISNCNNSDNYKNPTSTYIIVSSGITTPIHSTCVSPGQSLQTNMQVPALSNQSVFTSMQAPKPQSLTQVQIKQVIQPLLNSTAQSQSIQHINSVNQHVTQKIPQQYQPMSPGNVRQQNMSAQFQKSFIPQNQSVLHNCVPIQQSVNQMINQQAPQYYNAPLIQSQNVTSESSSAVSMSYQQKLQSTPSQNHVQLQQNQQQLPFYVQQQPSPPSPQQQKQIPQQMREVGHQLQGSQIQHNSQQTHHNTELTQMTNQPQQIPQSNQIENQMQQIGQQFQQITPQTQLEHPKQMQTTQIQPPSQLIPQQQQISQMIQQNNQQTYNVGQIIPQKPLYEGQQLNQQNQQAQQHQHLHKIQQQMIQTSHPSQPTSQQILQPNQYMPQQNQVLTDQLEINHSNSKTSIPQSQNQQIIQPQQSLNIQQAGQQYQQMMQSQSQRFPMQNNQPIMYQATLLQDQSLNTMQLQQVVMQIPTNTVSSTQMHLQQPQPEVHYNMMQQPTYFFVPQNNIQPAISMSQQQMTYSMQEHASIHQNHVDTLINSMQNCYTPSQQQMAPYKPSIITAETVDQKIEDNNTEDVENSTFTSLSIDIKIEQAIDLVKSHLMYAVREEVEILNDKIAELINKVRLLEIENSNLKKLVPPDMLE